VDLTKVSSEDYLLQKASEGAQQLLKELWSLPLDRSDANSTKGGHEICAILPSESVIHIPRSLPPPPPKVETKWEQFAKERGMQPGRKRERKVWDEATGTWLFRHGYQKANDKEWPIMEVKKNDDPYADPWEKAREAKRARVEKNVEAKLRNQERAGAIPRGTATKVMKNRQISHESGKHTIKQEMSVMVPSGVPVDLKGKVQRGKELTKAALAATQRSTASLGKFDKMLADEPERKSGIRRRKFESSTSKTVTEKEAGRGMKILQNVLAGGAGSSQYEKDRRSGKLARGETAYDYDYNDGLGDQGYKKKKGRAGAGKMKKVTKKRIK
jgi:regulator of ribosome biosynthesis